MTEDSQPAAEVAVRSLYQALLASWNMRDANAIAGLYSADGTLFGFDGSQLDSPAAIASELGRIFASHPTAAFVGKVRGVRVLSPKVAVLSAVAGMVPPGKSDLNPAVNAVQTLVAVAQEGRWRIALFQNTPAAYHGRPERSEQLTSELREVLRAAPPPA